MWVGRNREYSIACNGLVNKLAKIQLEIPHVVYSVPSEVNYLADIFSRAFTTSRFLDKSEFALSKAQANKLPPLTEPFIATESALYQYFTLPLNSESADEYPRKKAKISTPKPVSSLYKLFQDCTPEEKYLSAIRLLQGWDDPSLADSESNSCLVTEHSPTQDKDRAALQAVDIMQKRREDLFTLYSERVIQKTMKQLYGDLDPAQQKRLKATLKENHRNLFRENLINTLKEDFLAFEKEKESVQVNYLEPCKDDITVKIKYSVIHPSCFHPSKQEGSPRNRYSCPAGSYTSPCRTDDSGHGNPADYASQPVCTTHPSGFILQSESIYSLGVCPQQLLLYYKAVTEERFIHHCENRAWNQLGTSSHPSHPSSHSHPRVICPVVFNSVG